jgi:hypothetical protein
VPLDAAKITPPPSVVSPAILSKLSEVLDEADKICAR